MWTISQKNNTLRFHLGHGKPGSRSMTDVENELTWIPTCSVHGVDGLPKNGMRFGGWTIRMFPKIGVVNPPKWMVQYIMENTIKMDDLGVPLFLKTPIRKSHDESTLSGAASCLTKQRLKFRWPFLGVFFGWYRDMVVKTGDHFWIPHNSSDPTKTHVLSKRFVVISILTALTISMKIPKNVHSVLEHFYQPGGLVSEA